jgi:hypothetical protein
MRETTELNGRKLYEKGKDEMVVVVIPLSKDRGGRDVSGACSFLPDACFQKRGQSESMRPNKS